MQRRTALITLSSSALFPSVSLATTAREITWDDLIPPGVPYSEIIGEGEMDIVNDTWNPIYDANGVKLNEALDNAFITMPGFVVPLETSSAGVTEFLLVPYVGACVHVPPPPANQLVLVKTDIPWSDEALWDPVWVTGIMRTRLADTDLGQTGYFIDAKTMELYEW